MTAYVLSANSNIDSLLTKTGGDTYDTNGFTLTIDQDSRVGLNQTTSASMGSITINASKGGVCNIDGTGIWMIPYTGGSGNVPAWNTVISNNTGSGKLIAVHSALTAASTATGAAMPATGFIRIKQKTGTFAAGALTGITATASDAGRVGWLEVVGDEGATINANRLGTVNITGAWYAVGTTNGSAGQTFQIPNNGLLRYIAGVYIEKTVGSGTYDFYPNAGTVTFTGSTVGIANDASRGKVCWINNSGLVTIGNGGGTGLNGHVPVTGLAVVVPNIFLENATTAARTANVIPSATVATRYDFTCTGGGVVNINKANFAWYGSFTQAYQLNITDSCFIDAIIISEIATPLTLTRLGVGNKPTTALLTSPLTLTFCYAGGTVTDCVWARVSQASANATTCTMQDCEGFTFIRDISRSNTVRANGAYSWLITRAKNCTWTDPVLLQSAMGLVTCDGITINNTVYIDCVSGTTGTTNGAYVYNLSSNTINCTFTGLTYPVTNTHPYAGILLAATGCSNIKLRNIGSRVSPLTFGSANASGLVYAIGTNCSNFKIQRVYVSNTRTGIMTGDNSCKNILEENVFGDYADAVDVMACLNMTRKGMGGTGALTAQVSVYGTHWRDGFTSTTAGRIAILMNEATAETLAQATLAGGANFTSAGGLYMPVIGQSAIFEMPGYVLGHTAFTNTALIMAGGTATNYTYEFAIDKNDGNGFSTITASAYTATTLGTALAAVTGIDASKGFKLRLKITTGTTNTTAITSVYITTTSTTTAQDYQYPLDSNTVTFTGLPVGADAVVLTAGTSTILASIDSNPSTSFVYTYSGAQTVDVGFLQPGYVPLYIRGLSLTTTDSSIPVSLTVDRNYI